MQDTFRRETVKVGGPIEWDVDRYQDQRSANLAQLVVVTRIDDLLRPKPNCFLALRIGRGERVHFAPPMTQEPQRQVAESTNANHSDPGKWTDIMLDDRIEYSYSDVGRRPDAWRRLFVRGSSMSVRMPLGLHRSFRGYPPE